MQAMKIAVLAPLFYPIRRDAGYGGVELVIRTLVEEYVRLGHEVTLFALAGSEVPDGATLVEYSLHGDLNTLHGNETGAAHTLMLLDVRSRFECNEFNVIHNHIDTMTVIPFAGHPRRHLVVSTVHNSPTENGRAPIMRLELGMPFVPISQAHARGVRSPNWTPAILHGIHLDDLTPVPSPTCDYLVFLGRLDDCKGIQEAIDVARNSGLPLKIGAKVRKQDRQLMRKVIVPAEREGVVISIEEVVGRAAKREFLGNARALLFPIKWNEPFGLVMIEAMACGTPVLAFAPDGSSVREVVDDGFTGFISSSVAEMTTDVDCVMRLDRDAIRAHFERQFSSERMAREYLSLFQTQLMKSTRSRQRARALRVA